MMSKDKKIDVIVKILKKKLIDTDNMVLEYFDEYYQHPSYVYKADRHLRDLAKKILKAVIEDE